MTLSSWLLSVAMGTASSQGIREANRLAWELREYAGFNVPILLVLLAVIGLSLGVLFLANRR